MGPGDIFINMAEEQAIKKNNPEFSVVNEKNELKKIDTDVGIMKNRVELLRQQLQKEKDTIKKNKELTKDVIQKKIEVNRINRYVRTLSRRSKKTARRNSARSKS